MIWIESAERIRSRPPGRREGSGTDTSRVASDYFEREVAEASQCHISQHFSRIAVALPFSARTAFTMSSPYRWAANGYSCLLQSHYWMHIDCFTNNFTAFLLIFPGCFCHRNFTVRIFGSFRFFCLDFSCDWFSFDVHFSHFRLMATILAPNQMETWILKTNYMSMTWN